MTRTLAASGLRKQYSRRWVVDGIDLHVGAGETVGLLGPNGAGKTTTFYMVVGIETPDAGSVRLGDEDITNLPLFERARRGVRYLPQEPSVFQRLTALENLIAVLEIAGYPKQQIRDRAHQTLAEFGIDHLSNQQGITLSGGERRRLEIARAMVTEPDFFLLDEPFAGIDPIAVQDLKTLVRDICTRGIGVLISDHNVRETLSICDRAYVMHEGRLMIEGDPETITNSEDARQVYLGDAFRL